MKRNYTNIILAAMLILVAMVSRVVNAQMHLYNFAPLAAIGLFSGAVVKDKRYAFLFALLGQLSADLYFQLFTNTPGFYGISQFFTYGGLVAATALGILMGQVKAGKVILYTLGASTLFFILSNFGVWLSGMWGLNFKGFVTTYVSAIPYYRNAIIGDMAGSIVLFGAYFLLQQAFTAKMQKAKI